MSDNNNNTEALLTLLAAQQAQPIRVPTIDELKTKDGMETFLHEVILYALTGKLSKFQIDGINKTVKEIRENKKNIIGVDEKVGELANKLEEIKRSQSAKSVIIQGTEDEEDLPIVGSLKDLKD